MIDFNRPLQTKEGNPVRIICTDRKHSYPVVALVFIVPDVETIVSYTKEGKVRLDEGDSPLDLENVVETVSQWSNEYEGLVDAEILGNVLHPTLKHAQIAASSIDRRRNKLTATLEHRYYKHTGQYVDTIRHPVIVISKE